MTPSQIRALLAGFCLCGAQRLPGRRRCQRCARPTPTEQLKHRLGALGLEVLRLEVKPPQRREDVALWSALTRRCDGKTAWIESWRATVTECARRGVRTKPDPNRGDGAPQADVYLLAELATP